MKKILYSIICTISLLIIGSNVIAASVQDAQYYYNLGADYEHKNNRLGGAEMYSKALELNPDFDEARIARAKVYYFYEKYDKALADFMYFYNKPKYGAATYYEYRIECKKKLEQYPEAIDDMYEVILVYGGQAKVLKEMFETIQEHPEFEYKLKPIAHPNLITKYKSKAKALRDYAQIYKDKDGTINNQEYYDFFINIAKAMDPDICLDVEYPTEPPRKAPDEGQVIDVDIK